MTDFEIQDEQGNAYISVSEDVKLNAQRKKSSENSEHYVTYVWFYTIKDFAGTQHTIKFPAYVFTRTFEVDFEDQTWMFTKMTVSSLLVNYDKNTF